MNRLANVLPNPFRLFVSGFLALAFLANTTAAQETLTDKLQKESLVQLAQDAGKFGDPSRGAVAFYQPAMNCARCHAPQSNGNKLGPDLEQKRDVDLQHLVESVLNPSAKIKEGFETVQILTADGETVSALFVSEDDRQLSLRQLDPPNQPFQIAKDDIDDWKKTKLSSMPESLVSQLSSRQQFLDLVSYLNAIAKGGPVVAGELKPSNAGMIEPLPEYESRIDHAGLIKSLNDESYLRGEETYRLRCASCHGTVAEEGSMPTSLRFATGKFKNGNEPYRMYQTLTHGYGMMIPQRWMVPQQKYDVIHYIRKHFLEPENPDQLFKVTPDYLASLPAGDTRGPKPVVLRPWTMMDYGSSFINTIEVSRDGSNIAQKGIAIRLDNGPGGVESGKYWMMYDHDTMRLAGAWSGGFIDYEGIHFNGTHGRHPSVAGNIHFANPTGPGWGRPSDGSFEDNRLVGRDDKHYGPLDRSWAQYKGMYRFGNQTIIQYTIGETTILESPALQFVDRQPVFQRSINLGSREKELVLQLANVGTDVLSQIDAATVVAGETPVVDSKTSTKEIESKGIELNGATFGEITNGKAFAMWNKDYSISCRIKTTKDGTIFAKTQSQDEWMANGKTFFIRGGRLALDIGWVGDVQSNRKVADGKWHDVGLTWKAKTGQVQFYVDGKKAGAGELAPKDRLPKQVVRIGFTNDNFPGESFFEGSISNLKFHQRLLSTDEMANLDSVPDDKLVACWNEVTGTKIPESNGRKFESAELDGVVLGSNRRKEADTNLLAHVSGLKNPNWEVENGNLRLRIPAGKPVNIIVSHVSLKNPGNVSLIRDSISEQAKPRSLQSRIGGGPPSYPETLTSKIIRGDESQPYAVDVFERPVKNPWNAQLRLTGLDFLPDGNTMVASAWDGSVWKVHGFAGDSQSLSWKRIAAGLFQPLGIKWIDGKIYVTCRDQLAVLHDLNDDGEIDWYQSLNNDHQVTEHFHEFAMGLQTDAAGNFYYAKSARHAKTALVPHHGTLLKVTADGKRTEILAKGFRAANGVCINPDGSFVVTDQEGHWNPKNRINWVKPGGFYGNMFGYHDVTDDSDSAMDSPLCWITNEFDRSPSELLWVDSDKWGPLSGSLLNFSYGYGKIYVVPFEEIDGQKQGGMCEFPLAQFPTGVMRGRFHPVDGQLYCCGMFAWAGTQQQPGGLYRIRYTGKPVHLPVGLKAKVEQIEIKLSGAVDPASAKDPSNYSINTWDLKRTANYGSKHYNEKRLNVVAADLKPDGQTIVLTIPELKPTWGMEINYSLKTKKGKKLQGKVHNSIYKLGIKKKNDVSSLPLHVEETHAALTVIEGDKTVLVYNKLAPPVPDGIDEIYERSGFIHPLKTPSGTSVTDMYPKDHAHQSGVFAAWVDTTYDNRKIDFWNIAKGSGNVAHSRVVRVFNEVERAGFEVELIHKIVAKPKRDVLNETWKVTVFPSLDGRHCFDLETTQIALTQTPLHVNQYRYGGVAIRGLSQWLAPKKGASSRAEASVEPNGMLNDLGSNRITGNHQPTRWVSMWGLADGKPVSTTVMSHPRNFLARQPARLHPQKPYFCFAPCVNQAFVIDKANPFKSRYRYYISDAKPDPDWLNKKWSEFASEG